VGTEVVASQSSYCVLSRFLTHLVPTDQCEQRRPLFWLQFPPFLQMFRFFSMQHSFAVLSCLLAILGTVRSEVAFLNDDSFEHQTQASTGATTGSWLIMMGTATGCSACATLKPMFEELGQDEELYDNSIVLGNVDVNESPSTAMRFGIQTIPSLLYLHKKKLYRFPVDVERSVESMKEFVLQHYEKSPAEDIPPPPAAVDQFLDVWKKLQESGLLFYAFLAMAAMLIGTIGVLIATLFASSKGKGTVKKD
jgi:thiol-disulfide isomerase/thioredoxin